MSYIARCNTLSIRSEESVQTSRSSPHVNGEDDLLEVAHYLMSLMSGLHSDHVCYGELGYLGFDPEGIEEISVELEQLLGTLIS